MRGDALPHPPSPERIGAHALVCVTGTTCYARGSAVNRIDEVDTVINGASTGLQDTTQVINSMGCPTPTTCYAGGTNNVNQSAATIPVSALQVLDGSGTVVRNLNTHFLFVRGGRDDLPGAFYVYGFSARDLPRGSYTLTYQAGADPTIYRATFLR